MTLVSVGRHLTIIDPSLHNVEDYVRKELNLQWGKKMMESLFSIMFKVLGDVSEDAERWDIAFFCPKPIIKSSDNGLAVSFYIRYFNGTFPVLNMTEERLQRHQEYLVCEFEIQQCIKAAEVSRYVSDPVVGAGLPLFKMIGWSCYNVSVGQAP